MFKTIGGRVGLGLEISKLLHVQKGKRYEKTSKVGGEGKLTE